MLVVGRTIPSRRTTRFGKGPVRFGISGATCGNGSVEATVAGALETLFVVGVSATEAAGVSTCVAGTGCGSTAGVSLFGSAGTIVTDGASFVITTDVCVSAGVGAAVTGSAVAAGTFVLTSGTLATAA